MKEITTKAEMIQRLTVLISSLNSEVEVLDELINKKLDSYLGYSIREGYLLEDAIVKINSLPEGVDGHDTTPIYEFMVREKMVSGKLDALGYIMHIDINQARLLLEALQNRVRVTSS